MQRAAKLQDELLKKTTALGETQQRLERCEQEKAALKENLDKMTEEGKSLAADLQKVKQEKENQRKELVSTQESLGQTNKALKESRRELDTERKSHKLAIEERVGFMLSRDKALYHIGSETHTLCLYFNVQEKSNEKTRQELLKNNETIAKTMNESQHQVEQLKEVSVSISSLFFFFF